MNFTELRDSVANSEVNLANVLRQTKIFAYRLGETSFKQWVEYELNGYPADVTLPAYRRRPVQSLGTFVGFGGLQIKNQIIPAYFLPDDLKTTCETVYFRQGIHEIEQIALSKQEMIYSWPAEAVILARPHIQVTNGAQLAEAHQVLPNALFESILGVVRNRLLDFLLELAEAHPEVAQEVTDLKSIPRKDIAETFNITIQGNYNIIASGRDFSQSVNQTVAPHDLDAVLRVARDLQIPDDDVKDLQDAIKADKTPKQKEFGPKVKEWLGKAMSKLASGVWQMTLKTAPTVISKALADYYGWKS
jgi:hypothetical protein